MLLAELCESNGQAAAVMRPGWKSLQWGEDLSGCGVVLSPQSHVLMYQHCISLCAGGVAGLSIRACSALSSCWTHHTPASVLWKTQRSPCRCGAGLWGLYCSAETHQLGANGHCCCLPSLWGARASLGSTGKDLGKGSVRGKQVVHMDGTSQAGVQRG